MNLEKAYAEVRANGKHICSVGSPLEFIAHVGPENPVFAAIFSRFTYFRWGPDTPIILGCVNSQDFRNLKGCEKWFTRMLRDFFGVSSEWIIIDIPNHNELTGGPIQGFED